MMSKPVIITRRIQLLLQGVNKDERQGHFRKLIEWQQIVAKAANWIATHHYVQENLKDLFYLKEGAIVRLTDARKDPDGILTTSRMSTTYRLLSGKFKGQIPMAVISSLNSQIISAFNKEKKEYADGKRSLRTYKKDLPIPIVSSDIVHINPADGEYTFTLYGLPFRTNFGRDASGNRDIFEKALSGSGQQVSESGYKLCNSSLEIKGNKLFLLAVFSLPPTPVRLSGDTRVEACLSIDTPIVATMGKEEIRIGGREEYLYRRLAIQGARQRAQKASLFSRSGKGRKKKLQALERFHELEKNYVTTRLHQYSARLIDFCRQHGAGVLVLKAQQKKESTAKEEAFLLRNWTYYGLKEKIEYKAAKYGIKVIIE